MLDQQLADQAERHELEGHHHQQHANYQRRSIADGVAEDLFDAQPRQQAATDEAEDETHTPEQVERPAYVSGEELDRDQVKDPAIEARSAELRSAMEPVVVLDGDLADLEPGPGGEHRDVAVQLAVHVQGLGHRPAHGLESAVQVPPGDPRDQSGGPVVQARGVALHEAITAVADPRPGDQVEALVEGGQQLADLPGVVLAIGIHQHHGVALRLVEADAERR